jgi:hypothetical protein
LGQIKTIFTQHELQQLNQWSLDMVWTTGHTIMSDQLWHPATFLPNEYWVTFTQELTCFSMKNINFENAFLTFLISFLC